MSVLHKILKIIHAIIKFNCVMLESQDEGASVCALRVTPKVWENAPFVENFSEGIRETLKKTRKSSPSSK